MIALTGPTGFLGQALLAHWRCSHPAQRQLPLLRRSDARFPDGRVIGELDGSSVDPSLLEGCEVLIHAAARAHRMEDDPLDVAPYRQVNVLGSVALVQAAIRAGLRRVVFVSSIKVCGEGTAPGVVLRPDGTCAAVDAYGISKHEAAEAKEWSGLSLALCDDGGLANGLRKPVTHAVSWQQRELVE